MYLACVMRSIMHHCWLPMSSVASLPLSVLYSTAYIYLGMKFRRFYWAYESLLYLQPSLATPFLLVVCSVLLPCSHRDCWWLLHGACPLSTPASGSVVDFIYSSHSLIFIIEIPTYLFSALSAFIYWERVNSFDVNVHSPFSSRSVKPTHVTNY